MGSEARERDDANRISRRVLLKTAGVAAGVVALAPRIAGAQTPAPMAPPSTITRTFDQDMTERLPRHFVV